MKLKNIMKLKIIILIITLYTSFGLQSCENNIIIRPATSNDLDSIDKFNKNCFQKDLKPIVAQTITTEQKLDCFIDKLILKHQNFCQDFITKQLNQEDYSIIVAHTTSAEEENPLIGYCRFHKKNAHTIQIGFLGVDELFRKQGIAKKLVLAAIHKFNGITECTFRTFSNYDFINELYGKHHCIITGTVFLNPSTEEFSTDSSDRSLIPFYDYTYTIQK